MSQRWDALEPEKHGGSYSVIIASHAPTMAEAFDSDRYASGFALARPTLANASTVLELCPA